MAINYAASVLCVTFFFYKSYPVLGEWAAFDFALLGQISNEAIDISRTLIYLQSGVNFFFMTLVFAFFINHLKQRTFSD